MTMHDNGMTKAQMSILERSERDREQMEIEADDEAQDKDTFLEGRRYQHQQDEQRLIARATTIPATKKPWDYAHEGKVVVIPEKDWDAFVNLKIEGE